MPAIQAATGAERARVISRIQELVSNNAALKFNKLFLQHSKSWPRLAQASGMYPHSWENESFEINDRSLLDFHRIWLHEYLPIMEEHEECCIGARKDAVSDGGRLCDKVAAPHAEWLALPLVDDVHPAAQDVDQLELHAVEVHVCHRRRSNV